MLAGALNIPNDPLSNGGTSKLPDGSLFEGDNRKQYFEFGVPLYEASIKCDWKAAERILDKKKELVRFSITNNGETALHVAASVKRSKHVETFVKNLMKRMDDKDLELVNKNSDTALYLAVAAGNIKTVRMMVERNKNLPLIAGAGGILMPLYTAAFYGHHEVVKYLYEKSGDLSDNGWNSQNRGWLLRKCVEGDMFDVALKIVTIYPELGSGSVLENLARKPEAFSKSRPNIIKRSIHSVLALIGLVGAYNKESEALQLLKLIWKDIPQKTKKEIEEKLISWNDLDELKHIKFLLLQKFVSEQLHKLDKETQNIMMGSPNEIVQISESTSEMLSQATQLNELISRHLEKMRVETQKIYERSYGQHDEKAQDLQNLCSELMKKMDDKSNIIMRDSVDKTKGLQNLISKYITAMGSEITFKESQCSQVPFIAAEMGNTIFLVELIRQYPDLISILNDKSQSIFHIAVKHRHEGIYNLLYEIGSVKDMVTNLRDADENNILHLAAKRAERERLADVSGAALQMQRELLWFKEVRDRIPPVYREKKNKEGLTPRQLFTKEHRDLITDGEKWMKETASQCMVVAALIATIVFASAFTIPGGYNQNNGIPIFYRKPTFIVFVVADALSLFLSSTSILTFLSILTSRYAEHDFVSSLPNKLMLGVTTLFLSITAMMVTFSVSFFILYHNEMKWIPVSISALAVTPVLLYVALQHHVLVDVTRSTFGSWYLFKPKKQFLYYINPRD